jgi:hypothetical protein
LRVGGAEGVGGFLGLGIGRYRVDRRLDADEAFWQASLTAGLDVRLAPPLALRFAVRHQEVCDAGHSAGGHARFFMLLAGFGVGFGPVAGP